MPWITLGGTAQRKRNTETGVELSRRQYDRLYGRLAAQGFRSNERQAKVNREKSLIDYLSRPARGRVSIRREGDAVKAARVIEYNLQKQDKGIRRGLLKSKRLTNSSLPKGKQGIRFSLPLDLLSVYEALDKALSANAIFGAGVGLEGVSAATTEPMAFTVYGAFLMRDWRNHRDKLIERISAAAKIAFDEKGYFIANGFFVWFTWSIEWRRKYRNWKG